MTDRPVSAGKRGPLPSEPCGTHAAYKRHQRRKEEPCAPCREAWNAYQRELTARRKARA